MADVPLEDIMAATAGNNVAGRGRTVPEILALAFGAIYLLIGIIGFFITGFDDFFGHTDKTLLGFEINGCTTWCTW
jgi:hypothetical protein